ncbi:MAG: hypothetical protein NXY57DRAFT_990121 [Lentinula lateritia]|uniref:Hyaluronan/mRNA-binding protein domain-containing protein n=1 Tax=Lentinula lateritia TaxID=40482 RepID=A0ABQ8VAE2_9AGAR|nr:MAG: hypothetical protein NXY57DRAFT_990121 [Lentinula lateritia]KAJ4484088.1 hypothetical protein C8R41DRAFT_921883 [Lentinula lateritia]
MSVASKNPFALLDEGAESRPSSPAPATKAPPPPAPAPARDNKRSTQRGSRGGQYYSRGGARGSGARGDGNPNQNGVEEAESAPKKFDGSRGRARGGRGRGGARGGRPDRHSQTGKTDSEKKIHQGWGGDEGKSELQVETEATVDAAAEQAGADAWGATGGNASAWDTPAGEAAPVAATEDKPERENRRREEEEEDNTLTFDQYLAQKKENDALPKPQVRQANEGADGDFWKGAVALQKDEDAYFVGKNKTTAPKSKVKKEEKVFIEIEGRFDRPARGGRGRGDVRGGRGRGEARGEGRRGGARGGRQNNGPTPATINVDDEAAFPSLS